MHRNIFRLLACVLHMSTNVEAQAQPPKKQDLVPSGACLLNPRLIAHIHAEFYRLWGLTWRGRWTGPCMHPVSMSRAQWKDVVAHMDDYVVSEKPDGVQYYLLLTRSPQGRNLSVMLDRSGKAYPICVVAEDTYFAGTLLVGELSWAQDMASVEPVANSTTAMAMATAGTSTLSLSTPTSVTTSVTAAAAAVSQGVWRHKFKIFSCLSLRGAPMYTQSFETRHQSLCEAISIEDDPLRDTTTWVERAAILAKEGKLVCAGNAFCMMFTIKPWQPLSNMSALTRTTCQATDPSDGLIVQNMRMPERPGRREGCYKWKGVHTLDFAHTSGQLFVQCGPDVISANQSGKIRFQNVLVEFIVEGLDGQPDGIGEFVCTILGLDPSVCAGNVLKVLATFKEQRLEKNSPNDTVTVNNTLINIVECMTLDEIMKDVDAATRDHRQGIACNKRKQTDDTASVAVAPCSSDDISAANAKCARLS